MLIRRRASLLAAVVVTAACAALSARGSAGAAGPLTASLYIAGPATVTGGSTFTISPHAVVSGAPANAAEIDLAYPTSMDYVSVNNAGSQFPFTLITNGGGGQTEYVGGILNSPGIEGDIIVDNTSLRAGCLSATATIKYRSTTSVSNSDGATYELVEKTKKITVTSAPSTTACAAPSFAGDGAKARKITIYGSGFVGGASVSFGPGITVTAVSVSSPTRLVATTTVDRAAAVGARDITVIEPDSSTLACSACFTVNPSTTATSMSPNSLARGTTTPVEVYGADVFNGSTVTISGTGVTAAVTGTANNQAVDAEITVTAAAATGTRTVTVHNTDGSVGVCRNCLTIT